MMALVFNGVVVQIEDTPFPVHPSLQWIPCDNTVEVGYLYDGTSFTPPV